MYDNQYLPKPYEPFGRDINVKTDLSNYATKADLKNTTRVDTSKLAAKPDSATILPIIFWDILMFDKIFVSPQVKRIVIISNKHGIYELPHELPNDLRLRTLGN